MDTEGCASKQKRKSMDDEGYASKKNTMLTADAADTPSHHSKRIQWMWNSSAYPFSNSKPAEWRPYDDIENMIIEEAFIAGQSNALLDDYHIDLKHNLQISNNDDKKQRPVKRMECNKDDKRVRGERFMHNPVALDRPFGGQYGFISPFIKVVVKDFLKLTKEQLPSKNETIVPEIVEKAALGIIEEGKLIGKQCRGECMAKLLTAKKEAGMEEVWKCCAYLYSLQSFLFEKSNEIMRLIGSEQHEQIWRSKIRTIGPFCLLLWDNPFSRKLTKPGTILYRGAQLPEELITSFKHDCSKDSKPWRSFQAFTSCSRNRKVAEMFGNVLFIMEAHIAFTVDLQPFSNHWDEEEELLFPGISFTIDKMEFDENESKHLIYLTLQQRHNSKFI